MQDSLIGWLSVAACTISAVPAWLRWLRVAQREHYIASETSRFAGRWWTSSPLNWLAGIIAFAGLAVAPLWPAGALATAAVAAVGPLGLGVRGRSSPLVWTRRLQTLALVSGMFGLALLALGAVIGSAPAAAAAIALAAPVVVDLACRATAPLERRHAERFTDKAADKLRRVAPTVVAITGSYGKTSTKGALTHLASSSFFLLASPASYNNRAGLARTINENLTPGTEVFVAEMGTYGPGEIADLCTWIPPDIAVITAVGPVHLERFRSEARVLAAKSEIFEHAGTLVLPIDDPRLAHLAKRYRSEGRRVVTCSGRTLEYPWEPEANSGAATSTPPVLSVDVSVVEYQGETTVLAGDHVLADHLVVPTRPGNLACAIAIALELGVTKEELQKKLATLPAVAHRLEPITTPSGLHVLDDTYNSNPAGCLAALAALKRMGEASKRLVVVTPGMIELGSRQVQENMDFAARAAAVASHLVIVGRLNRRALLAGADRCIAECGTGAQTITVPTRQAAVAWVRQHTESGDAVLYENDLPDHFP